MKALLAAIPICMLAGTAVGQDLGEMICPMSESLVHEIPVESAASVESVIDDPGAHVDPSPAYVLEHADLSDSEAVLRHSDQIMAIFGGCTTSRAVAGGVRFG